MVVALLCGCGRVGFGGMDGGGGGDGSVMETGPDDTGIEMDAEGGIGPADGGDGSTPTDAATPDASLPDADAVDAVAVDADTGTPDALVPDAGPPCPTGMLLITGGAGGDFCIDADQSAGDTWTNAGTICGGRGARLCADAEWLEACGMSPVGLADMLGDWEWVVELESASAARKRGFSSCSSISSHEIFVDPYPYRCCLTP
jgi:hypothetical protein